MSVNEPTDAAVQALKEGLASRPDLRDSLRNVKGDVEALKMFRVKLEDVASGNWKRIEFIGWRFLAAESNKDGIIVDVASPARDQGPPRVTGVQRGPNAARTIEALRDVPLPQGVERADIELSFLNIPGLLTETIWIKRGGDAWVVPYHTLIKNFRKTPYTLEEYFAIAAPEAERRLKQDDGLSRSSV